MTREAIFREIETERQCQDAQHGGPLNDDALTYNDWIAILARHVGLAANDKGDDTPDRFRRQMVRIAAVAVAAAEAFDRVRGVEKIAGKHQSGSGW